MDTPSANPETPLVAAAVPASSSVIARTPEGEYNAPWLVYCERLIKFDHKWGWFEWVFAVLGIGYLFAMAVFSMLDAEWVGGVLFSIILFVILVCGVMWLSSTRKKTNDALRLANEPAASHRRCATQCVTLATVSRGGGHPGAWYIDPPMWRQRCGPLLDEGQSPPSVVSIDVVIPSDLLDVIDIYEEADVGPGRRLTSGARWSLRRILVLYSVATAALLSTGFFSSDPVFLLCLLSWIVGPGVYALARLVGLGSGVTFATASPRALSIKRFGKESVFTPNDSVLVVQSAGEKSGVRAYKEDYLGAKRKVKVIACREDGKTAELTFDDRRDAGLADLLARWNAPMRADETGDGAFQSRGLKGPFASNLALLYEHDRQGA